MPPTFEQRLNGSPQFLGVITTVGSSSQNNHGTAAPFNNTGHGLAGMVLLVQPDIDCYIQLGTTNAAAATASATSASMFLAAGERVTLRPLSAVQQQAAADEGWLAVIGAAAVNLKVWALR